jgi:hypothetical protein
MIPLAYSGKHLCCAGNGKAHSLRAMGYSEGIVHLEAHSELQILQIMCVPRAHLSVLTFRSPSVVSGRSPRLKFAVVRLAYLPQRRMGTSTISLFPSSSGSKTSAQPYWPCSSLE